MNADGSGREAIANHWGSPRWTRNRNLIASLFDYNIALYDPSTGQEHLILRDPPSANYGFSVSPDGKQFCYGGGQSGLYIATLDEKAMTTTAHQIVKTGSYHHSSFSPDGKRVVFSRPLPGVNNSLLHIVDVDGKMEPMLIPGQDETKYNCDPTWSPDGKTIVFSSELPSP